MKPEIDSLAKLSAWLKRPEPAIFHGQDLTPYSSQVSEKDLKDCALLGCRLDASLTEAAARAKCFIIPRRDEVVFDAFTPGLYEPEELFDALKTGGNHEDCLDHRIYETYYDTLSHEEKPVDLDIVLLKRLHDASIENALNDLLGAEARQKSVAIMGGHDVRRDEPIFAAVAKLALDLGRAGYTVVTGGGPGLMEAGNLGAYCAGFEDAETTLAFVIDQIRIAPEFNQTNWLKYAYSAWVAMGPPSDPSKSRNIGIPTWYYGHEPPNLFATHIAKYFQNSVREEGLLAIAQAGIIFAQGNSGTLQEIFQDANQNYYRTIANLKSPMILFGVDYWNPRRIIPNDPQKRKKVYPLLKTLATEKRFDDYILITDDTAAILEFIRDHPPIRELAP